MSASIPYRLTHSTRERSRGKLSGAGWMGPSGSEAAVKIHCTERSTPMSGGLGIREVGYVDCAGGGQVVVDGDVAFIAHMRAPDGTTIVDVSDPSKPLRLAPVEVPKGTHSHKVRVANGLMLVNREAQPADRPAPGFEGGLGIFDVSDPRRPREIAFWRCGGASTDAITRSGSPTASTSATGTGVS